MDDVAIGYCAMCGKGISYSPIHIPVSRPEPLVGKPARYGIQYAAVCVDCAQKAMKSIQVQVQRGELLPSRIWQGLEIVEGEWKAKEAPKGLLKRIINKLF